jgi:DNA-binding LacI/PurR family transcriptional regulator
MKRVTIKDVAREAGVSPAAVSRVFTKRASSSRKTQEKVLTAAKMLGYRPSMVARGLAGYRTNLVTLVAGRMVDPFDAIFQDLLSETMAGRGIQLLLASASSSESDDSGLLQALDYQSESVIVSTGTMSREHSEACVRAGLPIILMGRIVTRPGVDSVLADNANGVFCGSDSIAFGVIEAARALGLSIPDHLSVVGFNNVPPADWRSFRLTTIEYPIGRTIETIVDLLDKRLGDPGRPSEVRRIPTQLIVRATTRKILPGA